MDNDKLIEKAGLNNKNTKAESYNWCRFCGKRITGGRRDKKFCCVTCKNKFNNIKKHHMYDTRHFNEIHLKRNYKVLETLLCYGIQEMDLESMVSNGFQPEIVSSYWQKNDGVELTCLDIAYELSENKVSNIHRFSLPLQHKRRKR